MRRDACQTLVRIYRISEYKQFKNEKGVENDRCICKI